MTLFEELLQPVSATVSTGGWADLLVILIAFALAILVRRISWYLARPFVGLGQMASRKRQLSEERRQTLQGLFASVVTFFAFVIAIFFALSRFIDTNTLVWIAGLFSAAFGLGARPLVSDFLSGIGFLFEDTFDVGEKVEFNAGQKVEGVIEAVKLRTTRIRAPEGEIYTVPNGEIRVVRNFSRGTFSIARITLTVAASDLQHTLEQLEAMAEEAVLHLPNLLEPWHVYSESGALGATTELTIVAKARFGRAAEMRPRLLTFVQERLSGKNIHLAG
ncbi:MAG: mechanosensitive ion channel family protein [Anaerolineales bacterium]|nr:mechanosensitive ion channel family protein [Anaerolineales bacterium]